MSKPTERVTCENPKPGSSSVRIAKDRYDAMREALLRHIPKRASGVPFRGMKDAIAPALPADVFAGASVSWYLTVVKLDLEAKGLIERVPGARPQHLRRR